MSFGGGQHRALEHAQSPVLMRSPGRLAVLQAARNEGLEHRNDVHGKVYMQHSQTFYGDPSPGFNEKT